MHRSPLPAFLCCSDEHSDWLWEHKPSIENFTTVTRVTTTYKTIATRHQSSGRTCYQWGQMLIVSRTNINCVKVCSCSRVMTQLHCLLPKLDGENICTGDKKMGSVQTVISPPKKKKTWMHITSYFHAERIRCGWRASCKDPDLDVFERGVRNFCTQWVILFHTFLALLGLWDAGTWLSWMWSSSWTSSTQVVSLSNAESGPKAS